MNVVPMIDFSPEVPFADILRGELAAMKKPLLVAAASDRSVRKFCRKYGVPRSDVRRVRGWMNLPTHPDFLGRVLILLPGWSADAATSDAVGMWVAADGYTCEVEREPITGEIEPRVPVMRLRGYWAFAAMFAGVVVVEIVSPPGSPSWLGWLAALVFAGVAIFEAGEE